MAKRLTPIERAISGEPAGRRERYEKRLRDQGLGFVRILVPLDQAEQVRAFARELVDRRQASDLSASNDHD